jgi:hypothetical protein
MAMDRGQILTLILFMQSLNESDDAAGQSQFAAAPELPAFILEVLNLWLKCG